MTDTPQDTPAMPPQQKGRLAKLLPLLAIEPLVIGAVTLKDYLSFEALADNRGPFLPSATRTTWQPWPPLSAPMW